MTIIIPGSNVILSSYVHTVYRATEIKPPLFSLTLCICLGFYAVSTVQWNRDTSNVDDPLAGYIEV